MVNRPMRIGLSLATALALVSCTALAKLGAPDLSGSPDSTGLVVVDCEVEVIAAILGIRSSATPVGGLLARVDGEKELAEGGEVSGLVVFSGLTPGRWQLAMIEADWQAGNSTWRKTLAVDPAESASFAFDVRAGEPVYVGRVRIEDDARSSSSGVRFALDPDSGAEQEAWQTLAEIYDEGAWAEKLRSKL